jgi:hypothetical protein
MRTAMLALVFLVSTACTNSDSSEIDLPSPETATGHGAIIRLELIPVPEGPPGPVFARAAPLTDENLRPLREVRKYIPRPLPASLDQGSDCEFGGNLVVTFEDGHELTYGPCRRPPSIDHLWAGMLYVVSDGECVPTCGPGGVPGP